MGIRILLLLIFISFYFSPLGSAETNLTAAFIRDHQLWLKKDEQEIPADKGPIRLFSAVVL